MSRWRRHVLRFARRQPLATASAVVVALVVLLAVAAPLVAPYDPQRMSVGMPLTGPSATNLMGTDNFGRDLLSRIIWGARTSLAVGLIAVGVGVVGGTLVGLVSGYAGGKVDTVIQRLMDALMAFPALILALLITGMLGASIVNVMMAIGVIIIAPVSRVARSVVLAAAGTAYVEAARTIGCSDFRIMRVHILPNILAPIVVVATASLGNAILVEAALSFLGLGTPPPNPSWGGMVNEGQRFIESAPWYALFPGLAITVTVLSFNVVGDALRDVMDPRLRGSGVGSQMQGKGG